MTPDELVAAAQEDHRTRNGIPGPDEVAARTLAEELLRSVLGADLEVLDCSPLGAGWTDEFRAEVSRLPRREQLAEHGWLPLDAVVNRLGLGRSDRWAVRADGAVLAAVELSRDPEQDQVRRLIERAGRRGEVRLKDVLELCRLRELGAPFPEASTTLTAAADIEVGLGSRALVRWSSGRRRPAPVRLAMRRNRRRLVVAVSGVDGAGKSTLLESLRRDLEHCGLPVARVWLRPGMGLGRLTALAGHVKRRRGHAAAPGIALVSADPDRVPRSRTGLQGWVWSMLVTVAFLVGVRRQHGAARGVVLYDRHLLDALATLEFGYAGADLRVQAWLVRRFLPRADITLLLELPAQEAVARKEGDPIGERAVRRQLEAYAEWLPRLPAVHRLDATRPASEVASQAFSLVLAVGR